MNNRQLTTEEIRDIAFRTTGQSHNSDWKSYRYGKLTSSKFGRAISVMRNPHPSNLQRLRDELYVPKNLDHVPAIRWGAGSRVSGDRCVSEQDGKYRQTNRGVDVPQQRHGCLARWTGLH